MRVTFDDLDLPNLYSFIGWYKQNHDVEAVFFELKGWYLFAYTLPDKRLIQHTSTCQQNTFFQTLKPQLKLPQIAMSQCVPVKNQQVEDIVIQLLNKLNEEMTYNRQVVS